MTMVKGFQEISYDELMEVSGGSFWGEVIKEVIIEGVKEFFIYIGENISAADAFTNIETNRNWTRYNQYQREHGNWGNGSW